MLDALLFALLQAEPAATPQAPPAVQVAENQAAAEEDEGTAMRRTERRCRITPITGSRVGHTLVCRSAANREDVRDTIGHWINRTGGTNRNDPARGFQ